MSLSTCSVSLTQHRPPWRRSLRCSLILLLLHFFRSLFPVASRSLFFPLSLQEQLYPCSLGGILGSMSVCSLISLFYYFFFVLTFFPLISHPCVTYCSPPLLVFYLLLLFSPRLFLHFPLLFRLFASPSFL